MRFIFATTIKAFFCNEMTRPITFILDGSTAPTSSWFALSNLTVIGKRRRSVLLTLVERKTRFSVAINFILNYRAAPADRLQPLKA